MARPTDGDGEVDYTIDLPVASRHICIVSANVFAQVNVRLSQLAQVNQIR